MKKPRTVRRKDAMVPYMGNKRIPLMQGRPRRESAICHDDLLNLRIALATSKNLEEFLYTV
jgi:hypothetical protein